MLAPTQQQNAQPQTLAQAPMSQADAMRKQAMMLAWKAYRGEFNRPLKVAKDQTDDNVLSNRCSPVVDKGVSFLFGQVLSIEASDESTRIPEDTTPGGPLQEFLDCLWGDDDDRMTLLSCMAINGGVTGQVFVKLIPAIGSMNYPRLVVMDSQLVRIVTAPEDCALHLAYIIEYPGTADWQKKQIIARVDPDGMVGSVGEYDVEDTWTITNYMRKGQSGSWYQVGEQEPWPYPFAPILACQNLPNPNESWGVPDLTPDLIDLNKVLNFVQSNTSRILKFHAHPKTYATGLSASQINIGVDDLICLPSPDSKLANLEMTSNLRSSLDFARVLRSDMDEESRVPSVALGRLEMLPRGNISGVALQLLFQPLLEKTVMKQRLYGRLIREISRAALVLAGLIAPEDFEDFQITIHWQTLLPIDDLAAAQTALIYRQLSVSTSTILQKLGFDPADEIAKVQQEAPTMPPQPGPQQQQQGQPQAAESPFIGGGR